MPFKSLTLLWCLTLSLTTFAQDEELFSSHNIPENLKSKADAVIRYDKRVIVLNSQDDMEWEQTRLITVFNERGNKHVNAHSYYDDTNKIKSIEAIVFDKNGEEIKKIKKRDFRDFSAVDGNTLYNDSRVLIMQYDPVDYPYTVQFKCSIKTSNTAWIPNWNPMSSYNVAVENSYYSIVDKANLGLRHKEEHLEDYSISKDVSANSLTYEVQDLETVVHEDLSPNISSIVPRVKVAVTKFHLEGVDGEAENWNEFGTWMQKSLLHGRDEISVKTKNEIVKLTADCNSNIEKAEKIIQFVQNNTRYISVQVGIGGWRPISALEVDQYKYGDCKGLTNYTKALLKTVGVDSYYTVVQSGQGISDLDSDFTSMEGNHIILAIPNGDDLIWNDCTSQIHPFGFIGDFTDNRKVLVMKPEGGEIVQTEAYINDSNYQKTEATASIDPDASLIADIIIKTKGVQYDNRFTLETASDKDLNLYYNKYWNNINNLDIKSKSHKNDKKKIEFTEHLKITAQRFASANGGKLIFTPNAFNKSTFVPERIRSRKLPVVISRGYLDEDEFTFKIPDGYKIEAMPEPLKIVNEFGEYSMESSLKGDTEIVYKRKLLIKKGDYPKNKYNDYREFRKDVSRGDKAIVVLAKTI